VSQNFVFVLLFHLHFSLSANHCLTSSGSFMLVCLATCFSCLILLCIVSSALPLILWSCSNFSKSIQVSISKFSMAGSYNFLVGVALPAIVGRRVKLIIPVGIEKRVNGDLTSLAEKLNAPGLSGYRLLPVVGEVFTELDALTALTGADVELIAAGGVCGAEGSCWIAVTGTEEQEEFAAEIIASINCEPAFSLDKTK